MCCINPGLWGKLSFRGILHLLKAQYEKQMQEETYRIYTTDTLKYICESVTKYLGGRCMVQRYVDFTGKSKPDESESAEEIRARIGGMLGKMGGEDV